MRRSAGISTVVCVIRIVAVASIARTGSIGIAALQPAPAFFAVDIGIIRHIP